MQVFFRSIALSALTLAPIQGVADDRLQPDFTFKRVSVPSSGNSGNRITVQIAPSPASESSSAPTETSTAPDSPAKPLPAGWFWNKVSPDASASGPGRLEVALSALRDAPSGQGIAAPRLSTLQNIARAHGTDILRHTVGTDVSPALVLALISIESAGKSDAVSSAGATGLMQLMPATAERFGVTDRSVPSQNIAGGVAYLAWLLNHFENDPILALAGYNAGEGAVRDNNGVPPYAETRAYVPKVLAAWTVARALCQTPPELVTDGCVFSVGG